MPHVIRLHGPWTATFEDGDEHRQISFQAPAGLSDSLNEWQATESRPRELGIVQLLRRFNRPTGIDSEEVSVDLSIGLSHPSRLLINAEPIGELPRGEHRVPIKSRLGQHNELTVEMRLGSACTSVRCDARLVIEDTGHHKHP